MLMCKSHCKAPISRKAVINTTQVEIPFTIKKKKKKSHSAYRYESVSPSPLVAWLWLNSTVFPPPAYPPALPRARPPYPQSCEVPKGSRPQLLLARPRPHLSARCRHCRGLLDRDASRRVGGSWCLGPATAGGSSRESRAHRPHRAPCSHRRCSSGAPLPALSSRGPREERSPWPLQPWPRRQGGSDCGRSKGQSGAGRRRTHEPSGAGPPPPPEQVTDSTPSLGGAGPRLGGGDRGGAAPPAGRERRDRFVRDAFW